MSEICLLRCWLITFLSPSKRVRVWIYYPWHWVRTFAELGWAGCKRTMAPEKTQNTLTSLKNAQKVASLLKIKKKGVLTVSVHLYSKWLSIGFDAFQLQLVRAGVSSTGLGTYTAIYVLKAWTSEVEIGVLDKQTKVIELEGQSLLKLLWSFFLCLYELKCLPL